VPSESKAPTAQDDGELPLAGMEVIEVSQAVAGPTAARLLADFGASVVKVGSTVPGVTDGIVGQLHRGKRTILVNGRSARGGELTHHLLRRADALVTNFVPASQARYGIDYDRVHALNPRLVHCSITAYGLRGPWAGRRGYENQGNAATGMSWRYGARFGWTLYQPTPINDAGTGILGAFAVAVALYARGRGGSGQQVGASLVQASTLHQAAYLVSEDQQAHRSGRAGEGPDEHRDEHGRTALERLYRAGDRWLFLAARVGDLPVLTRVLGLELDARLGPTWPEPGGPLAAEFAARFAAADAADWVARLAGHGIAAAACASIDEAVDYLRGRGVVYLEPGVDGRDVPRPGIGRWLSRTPPRVGANPGTIGSQAVEVLADLGLDPADMTTLADADVIALPDRLPHLTRLT
jgi:crotonobetainyl-CoA:carnitine CoA-transferase CaiB-like acyl-CoA transferase